MVGRMLKLTYLAPTLLEKLLLERVPPTVPVKELTVLADMDWTEQMSLRLPNCAFISRSQTGCLDRVGLSEAGKRKKT